MNHSLIALDLKNADIRMFFVDLLVHINNVATSDLFRFRLKLEIFFNVLIFSYLENPTWNFLTEGKMEERDIIIKDNQGHFLIIRLKSYLTLRLTTSLVVDKSYKSHILLNVKYVIPIIVLGIHGSGLQINYLIFAFNFSGASQSSLAKKKRLGGWVIPHLDWWIQ